MKKDLEEFRSELSEAEVSEIETAIKGVEEVMSGDDKEKINEALTKVFPAMKSLLDKKQAKEQAQAQPTQPTQDDVVDATFTEKKE